MRNFTQLSNLMAARAIAQELSDYDRITLAQELCADVRNPRMAQKMTKATNAIGQQAHALDRLNITPKSNLKHEDIT